MTPINFQRFALHFILLSFENWVFCDSSKVEKNLFGKTGKEIKTIVVTFGTPHEFENLAYGVSTKYEYYNKEQKIFALYEALHNYTKSCQGKAHDYLSSSGYSYKSMWASNTAVIQDADLDCVNTLKGMKDVSFISADTNFPVDNPTEFLEGTASPVNTPATGFDFGLPWGVSKMYVPEAWKLGGYYGSQKTGKGVVVATIDSGVRSTHEALKDNFRSYNGWADGYNNSTTPVDTDGHGTHTLGILAGSRVGVAPGAQWITCRGCKESGCLLSALLFCCQWMLCPYNTTTSTHPASYKECYGTPDLVSNSWGGGQGFTGFQSCIKAWRAVGIIPVFAVHNFGPQCETVTSPGDYVNVIGVGAIDENRRLANFSSRGPTANGDMKPDVVAPGTNVISSYPTSDNAYVIASGTSMATPYVAGVIALMLERCRMSYKAVLAILQTTAEQDHLGRTTQICGGTNSSSFPNNFYGFGMVHAFKAVKKVLEVCHLNILNHSPSYYAHPGPVSYPIRNSRSRGYDYSVNYKSPFYRRSYYR